MGPQLKVVEKARTATMLCAASGNPDPEISWFKDFLPVDTATSNGRIKQLRSGKVAKQVSLPSLLTLPPFSLYMQLLYFHWNVILNPNVSLLWACFFYDVKAVFGADPLWQDRGLLKCLLQWACLLEHHLDIFFGRPSWYCLKSLVGSDISLPTQWVSGVFNRSTVQIRIMRYWLRFFNHWWYTTLLLLQDNALLSIEFIAIPTMWHHKH